MNSEKPTQEQVDARTSDYICRLCGINFLTEEQLKEERISTYNESECGLCHEVTSVTHYRNWNYLRLK